LEKATKAVIEPSEFVFIQVELWTKTVTIPTSKMGFV
jgi:hypothetical protein